MLSIVINGKKILEDLVKNEDIDIIHAHDLAPAIPAVEVGEKYDVETYVTVHGPEIYNFYKKPFFKKQIEKVLSKTDHVLAVSEDLISEISKINVKNIKEKVSLHLNSVDIDKFKEIPHKNKSKPVVIFVGRLARQKNISLLLDAKKQSRNDYELLIVGDGPEMFNLKNKVKNENICDVKFMGFRSDVENILPYGDIFVLPSLFEGMGIALMEALACGLPVIGSDIGGTNELITPDVGLLIDPYDASSLSNAIDKLLEDEKLYNKLKSNTRKKAMEFSKMKIPYHLHTHKSCESFSPKKNRMEDKYL